MNYSSRLNKDIFMYNEYLANIFLSWTNLFSMYIQIAVNSNHENILRPKLCEVLTQTVTVILFCFTTRSSLLSSDIENKSDVAHALLVSELSTSDLNTISKVTSILPPCTTTLSFDSNVTLLNKLSRH